MVNDIENMIEVIEHSVDKIINNRDVGDHLVNNITYRGYLYYSVYNKTIIVTSTENETQLRIFIDNNTIVSGFYLSKWEKNRFNKYENIFALETIYKIKTYDQYFQQSTIHDLSWITFEQSIKMNSVLTNIVEKLNA